MSLIGNRSSRDSNKVRFTVLRSRFGQGLSRSVIALVFLFMVGAGQPLHAVPVCSTGADGNISITATEARVNVYFAAPDPMIGETIVPAGATSVPVDAALGPQATQLHASVDENISAGDVLIIVQMIGADIDSSDNHVGIGNGGRYGDGTGPLDQVGSIQNADFTAGHYEFVIATGPVAGGAVPVEGAGPGNGLLNRYVNSNVTTGSKGFRRYQVIKVPQFSRLSIAGSVVADRWNGRWGGIAAINVRDRANFTSGSLNADGRGFRGGQFFPDRSDASQGTVNGNFGFKGEGIAGIPQRLFSRVLLSEQPASGGEETGPAGYPGADGGGPAGTAWTRDSGPGAPGNAGSGGGGPEDAGGGGGGNAGRGGFGGEGINENWDDDDSDSGSSGQPDSVGIGGAAFPEHFAATVSRLVMGGGGGASNGNDLGNLDLTVSSGQAGGGIVFLRSVAINANAGSRISANGDSGGTAQSEGGGGGGAGGTILIHTDNSTVDQMTLSAIGGTGGSSNQFQDGGGGGGSGGVIWPAVPVAPV